MPVETIDQVSSSEVGRKAGLRTSIPSLPYYVAFGILRFSPHLKVVSGFLGGLLGSNHPCSSARALGRKLSVSLA